jgi:hypothetical protein
MNKLSKIKFMDELQLTDDEKIVWEGGASQSGIIIELLQGFLSLLVVIVVLGTMFNLDKIIMKKNPDYQSPVKTETAGASISAANKKQPAAKAQPEEIFNKSLIYLLTAAGGILMVISGIVASILKIRNYWFVVTSERVCIQSGIINIEVVTIDLDKIVSVIIGHSFWDRLFHTHSIEVVHAGGKFVHPNGFNIFNPYRIQYVPSHEKLPSELLRHWLPRDNLAARPQTL